MALVDDPKAFIARMFQMEVNEGRGAHCQIFPEGTSSVPFNLGSGELVYAIYKFKYYFTKDALYVSSPTGHFRIVWSEVSACSTKHGDGNRKSKISTVQGESFVLDMTDLAKGWSGRISQLIHGMIDRWGTPGTLGTPPMTIEEFLAHPDAEGAFAPNLEVRITLTELAGNYLRCAPCPMSHTSC
ncbi:hypothetical protein LPB67_11380 [Undibacterium sp. Jales W-56]|uniref:hypothetical protein n=1 Tax=Undibacterium sp. Jales W-56 TaxID=2897325 RepID=UPI0021D192D8|nr:hypothetical protein [Undibacterium sp. Jales W-56]MCU6434374.1 hypothetical protein [Undibacterium sp. Jales W-56]